MGTTQDALRRILSGEQYNYELAEKIRKHRAFPREDFEECLEVLIRGAKVIAKRNIEAQRLAINLIYGTVVESFEVVMHSAKEQEEELVLLLVGRAVELPDFPNVSASDVLRLILLDDVSESSGLSFGLSWNGVTSSLAVTTRLDNEGNILIEGTYGKGITTSADPGVALLFTKTYTLKEMLEDTDSSISYGGSASTTATAAVDINFVIKEDKLEFSGITQAVGVGAPGAEVHINYGQSKVLKTISLKKIVEEMLKKICGGGTFPCKWACLYIKREGG